MKDKYVHANKGVGLLGSACYWKMNSSLAKKILHVSGRFSKSFTSSAVLLKLPNNGRVYSPSHPSEHGAVALLVGWMASRNKVIEKYSTIYTQLGIPCVALAPNEQNVLFTSSGNKLCGAALETLEEMEKTRTNKRLPLSLIIHMFSGAGYAMFPKFLETWSQSDSILKTSVVPKCFIMDSGPTEFSIKAGVEAANLTYKQGGFNWVTYLIANAMGISTTILIGNQKRSLLRSALESDVLDIPQLYLHSETDTVATCEWVDKIMEGQRQRGRRVSSHCWEDTEHLKLYLEHKDEYTHHIHAFLKSCNVV